MSYISTSVKQTGKTANSATYSCTVSVDRTSYYGVSVDDWPIAIKNHTGTLNYIGWPKLSSWKSSWGQPDWRLSSEQWISSKYGYAQGMLLNDYTYTFSGTVSIDRGNSRKGSKTIKVGADSASTDSRFYGCMKEITLETEEIPSSKFKGTLSCTVDSPQTIGDRYIRLSASFDNPSSYYTAKLYNEGGSVITEANGTSISHNILITKDMFQTNKSFKVILWGKDGNSYDTKTVTAYIEPSGIGVTVKNSGVHDTSNMYFRNVNNKEIKEVWVRVNGKVYQTRK